MMITNSDISRGLYSGFVRLHILYHASREPVFGLNLMRELARHGYNLSPGTVYPALHQMETAGLLRSEKAVLDGKWRTYYRATDKGMQALIEAHEKARELLRELDE